MNYKNLAWAAALYVGVVAAIYKAEVQDPRHRRDLRETTSQTFNE